MKCALLFQHLGQRVLNYAQVLSLLYVFVDKKSCTYPLKKITFFFLSKNNFKYVIAISITKQVIHIITILILLILNQHFLISYKEEARYVTIRVLIASPPHFVALRPPTPISHVLIFDVLLPSLFSWMEAQVGSSQRLNVREPTQNTCT